MGLMIVHKPANLNLSLQTSTTANHGVKSKIHPNTYRRSVYRYISLKNKYNMQLKFFGGGNLIFNGVHAEVI